MALDAIIARHREFAASRSRPPKFSAAALRCPITGCVMRDPVVGPDGHSYEREALALWRAAGLCTSPATGAPPAAPGGEPAPNLALRAVIAEALGDDAVSARDARPRPREEIVAELAAAEAGGSAECRDRCAQATRRASRPGRPARPSAAAVLLLRPAAGGLPCLPRRRAPRWTVAFMELGKSAVALYAQPDRQLQLAALRLRDVTSAGFASNDDASGRKVVVSAPLGAGFTVEFNTRDEAEAWVAALASGTEACKKKDNRAAPGHEARRDPLMADGRIM